LIICQFGALKQIIVHTGAGATAGKMLAAAHISPLIVAFLMASASAGAGFGHGFDYHGGGDYGADRKGDAGVPPDVMYLALYGGGTSLSHVNDAGFWIVNQYSG
jgi:H+/gluconate symporter-like permease